MLPIDMISPQEILQKLKENGHRQTVARTALIEVLARDHRPLDAGEILQILVKRGVAINKTTLYRELAFLQQQGMVTDVRLNERQTRYELAGEHHHHVVCTSCDRIEEVELDHHLEAQEKKIEALTQFKIEKHSLEFFGLCAACQS